MWWIVICNVYEIFSFSSFILLTGQSRETISSGKVLSACCHGYNYIRRQKRSRDLFGSFFLHLFQEADVTRDQHQRIRLYLYDSYFSTCDRPVLLFSTPLSFSLFFVTQATTYECEREKGKEKKRDRNNEEGSEILLVHAVPTNELTDNGGPR